MRGFQFSVQTQSQANYVLSLCTKKVMLVLISAITFTFTATLMIYSWTINESKIIILASFSTLSIYYLCLIDLYSFCFTTSTSLGLLDAHGIDSSTFQLIKQYRTRCYNILKWPLNPFKHLFLIIIFNLKTIYNSNVCVHTFGSFEITYISSRTSCSIFFPKVPRPTKCLVFFLMQRR